ncbi:hypothetical protein OROMI_011312 [Orobanche minor]
MIYISCFADWCSFAQVVFLLLSFSLAGLLRLFLVVFDRYILVASQIGALLLSLAGLLRLFLVVFDRYILVASQIGALLLSLAGLLRLFLVVFDRCDCCRGTVEQMHQMFRLFSFKSHRSYRRQVADTLQNFPSSALALLELLLAIAPEERGNDFHDATVYGTTSGVPYLFSSSFHGVLLNSEQGAFTKLGPLFPRADGESVQINSKSLTKSNLLFVMSPAEVGYSYLEQARTTLLAMYSLVEELLHRLKYFSSVLRFCGLDIDYGQWQTLVSREPLPHHLLFECACGYALFAAPKLSHVGTFTFESVEEYLNSSGHPFKLKASYSYLLFQIFLR